MKNCCLACLLCFCTVATISFAQSGGTAESNPLENFELNMQDGEIVLLAETDGATTLSVNGTPTEIVFADGQAVLDLEVDAAGESVLFRTETGKYSLYHLAQTTPDNYRIRKIPMWLSILPPLIAILLALIFKEVIISLFLGVWVGAFIAGGMRLESIYYFVLSFWQVVEKYVVEALTDSGHVAIIVFSLLIGGMVAIISRNGGMAGVVQVLTRYAKTARSTQLVTWFLGVAIFFDDYANTLIVGNTMRSVTDKFRISREKLAYIVDSTAAPVAAVAFITTWIGAELGYIDSGIQQLRAFDFELTPYAIFISSLKYSFYPILTLCFILMLIYLQKDYGGMHRAEVRARTTGAVSAKTSTVTEEDDMEDLQPVAGAPLRWYNAVIPVLVVILVTIFGLLDTGLAATYSEIVDEGFALPNQSWSTVWGNIAAVTESNTPNFFMKIGKIIGNADSYVALLWASLSGVVVAIILTLGAKIMQINDTVNTMVTGFKTMLPAVLILTMAWSLAATTQELYTAQFLTSTLVNTVSPYAMPAIIFVLAALISFSTGSSWSTMAILYPIAIPTTWAICVAQGLEGDIALEILLNVIATVLAASVLGDHCSPISDTTILSSLASDCNHIDHVRTQLPYALTVGTVSLLAGTLSTLLGGGWLISAMLLLISLVLLFGIVWRFGKPVEE